MFNQDNFWYISHYFTNEYFWNTTFRSRDLGHSYYLCTVIDCWFLLHQWFVLLDNCNIFWLWLYHCKFLWDIFYTFYCKTRDQSKQRSNPSNSLQRQTISRKRFEFTSKNGQAILLTIVLLLWNLDLCC